MNALYFKNDFWGVISHAEAKIATSLAATTQPYCENHEH